MGRINSVLFTAETLATKPAWLQKQVEAFLSPPAPITPPKPAKARKEPSKRAVGGHMLKTRTRNGGTWTEAKYWGMMRSGLRRLFRFWKPAVDALKSARVDAPGPRGRKHLYLCADCKKLFTRKAVQIDHVEPVGRLLSYEDIPAFVRKLTPEDPKAFAVRCTECHQAKTNAERESKS